MDWYIFWTGFLTIGALNSLAMVLPGPDFALVLKNSYAKKNTGVFTAFGITVGIGLHSTYCLLGLLTLLEQAPEVAYWLNYASASYLIILGSQIGFSLIKSKITVLAHTQTSSQLRPGTAFMQGLLCNLLNPKAFLFLTSIYAYAFELHVPLAGVFIYAVMISSSALLWFIFLSKFICMPSVQKRYQSFRPVLEWLFCLFFIFLGTKLLLQTVQG